MLNSGRKSYWLRFLLILGLTCAAAPAQQSQDKAVRISATLLNTPDGIQLDWLAPSSPSYNITHQKIWRRQPGQPWGEEYDTLATSDLTYTDLNVVPGQRYEYRIIRLFSNGPLFSAGYIESGIKIKEVDRRGSVILLVRDTAAAALPTELTQLQKDLAGDGWHVIREDVAASATVTDVKAVISGHYNNPATPDVKSVFLFGRIPVPYSGDIVPDGHTSNHQGAWPADVFYAELDGTWTDTTVDTSIGPARIQNNPGDGKYDQSFLPSNTELEIGRVDFNAMTQFPNAGTSETDLLQRYLQKNHDYRHLQGNYTSVPRRGLVDDNFGYFGGEAFASNAWRNFTTFFGNANITSADWFSTLDTDTYLWAYGCGGGSYTSAGGIGNSAQFGSTDSKAVFCMLFGSYFGDWDSTNNFLRAPLAGTVNGLGLANMWAGRPHWHLHTMATGRTLGYGARVTQNNTGDYITGAGAGMVHVALMGDPTLRLFPVIPASTLTSTSTDGSVELNWTASTDTNIEGYAVYRGQSGADLTGEFTRLNAELVTGTSYTDLSGVPGTTYTYMVRAVKLETSASASYLNSSQGIFHTAAPSAVTGPEVNVTGLDQPIQSGSTGTLSSNGSHFGEGEINVYSQLHTFTIHNNGTSALTLSGAPVSISGAAAGDFTVTQPASTVIAAGGSETFTIEFDPTVVGPRVATVSFTSDDADEGSFTFAISGTGLENTPDIDVPTTSFSTTLASGATGSKNLTISNNGLGALDYSIISKYVHRDSDHASGPTYEWQDISSLGTEITSWSGSGAPTDNGGSASIPIGFSFPYFDSSHSSLVVSTEGFIIFGPWVNAPSNSPSLPNLGAPANMVAVYWDDLDLRSSFDPVDQGRVYYLQTDPDTFIIQYEGVYQFSESPLVSDDRLSCQIILKSSGEFILQYKEVPTSTHYTVGLQNDELNDGLTVAANSSYLSNEMAVRILPPAIQSGWITPTPNSGTVAPSGSDIVTLAVEPAALPFGSYFAQLLVNSNDPDTPMENITLDLTGGTNRAEIHLTGNNLIIPFGDTKAHLSNHTDLGELDLGAPAASNTITISNTGTADLTTGTITVTGSDFSVTQPATTVLSAGNSTTFQVTFPSGKPEGVYTATVTVPSDDANEASYTFAVSASQLGSLETWRKTHFGDSGNTGTGANDQDPDMDGIPNLAEYALGGIPTAFDSLTTGPQVTIDGNDRSVLTFDRTPALTDVDIIVQASSDLSVWDDIASSTAGAATVATGAHAVNESGVSPVKVTVTDTVIPPSKRFLRLKVTEN
ncbi:hypothetical protein NT6N_38340 [Oceaniferula spumae]|uniref:Fibronectin type-III domain-containing protein n=1 Tax=Oceaniferula spumae TaxID=2979115 RepID=A0AAT9FSC9_9BACT